MYKRQGAYLVLGGPLALRKTTLFGIIPTPETFLRLVPLTVQSWRDLLTVTPPASAFTGPAIVPYVSGLVLGAIAGRLVPVSYTHLDVYKRQTRR